MTYCRRLEETGTEQEAKESDSADSADSERNTDTENSTW